MSAGLAQVEEVLRRDAGVFDREAAGLDLAVEIGARAARCPGSGPASKNI